MLTASGGLGIGLATIASRGPWRDGAAVVLAVIAGASLLIVSMPMAVIYATGTLLGTAWLDMGTMARVHGSLNALGLLARGDGRLDDRAPTSWPAPPGSRPHAPLAPAGVG